MLNSVSADSFESIGLTNTPRNNSVEINTNDTINNNDIIIYRNNTSIFKDYFCIILLLASLCIICYIFIELKYN